jgi:hypothetical protein
MGIRGSFAIAQASDCVFIESNLEKMYPDRLPYWKKVGDDNVIDDIDRKFIDLYQQIGVPINFSKSKVHTEYGSFIEFVSRNAWEGLDYSIISPGLTVRFRKDNYYIFTLLKHLLERRISTDFNALLDMKRDALDIEEKDIKREAFELSLPLLRKQAAILQYAYPEEMFLQEEPSEYLDELSNEEIGNIIAGLIIIPISKLDSHYKERAARSRDDRIAHERFLIMERSFYIDKKFNDSWNFCRENQIEPVKLQSLLAIHCIENTMAKRMEQGQASYEKGLNTPSVVVDVSSEESSRVIINQDLIKYLLEFNLAVDEVVLDTKLVHRLSIMDKSNTKALHSLMKNLRTSFSFKL